MRALAARVTMLDDVGPQPATTKVDAMPRILVLTEPVKKPDDGVMLDEHLAATDLASGHFASQLIERIGWALADAESSERAPVAGMAGARAPREALVHH
jgi:thioesterase domain-containing protein